MSKDDSEAETARKDSDCEANVAIKPLQTETEKIKQYERFLLRLDENYFEARHSKV